MNDNKIAVIIPTYNEKNNIIPLIEKILYLPFKVNVIVVDDDSPDQTGFIAQNYFRNNERVKVLIRKEDRGRGSAGITGYFVALDAGFEIIGEMDGDFSHSPDFIPFLVQELNDVDVVSGSRFLKGSRSLRESLVREMITICARIYLRMCLGIRLTDPTSGFRFFKSYVLSSISKTLKSKDAFIITEVFYYISRKHFRIKEYPIIFYKRKTGRSKLKFITLILYLYRVLLLRTGFFRG